MLWVQYVAYAGEDANESLWISFVGLIALLVQVGPGHPGVQIVNVGITQPRAVVTAERCTLLTYTRTLASRCDCACYAMWRPHCPSGPPPSMLHSPSSLLGGVHQLCAHIFFIFFLTPSPCPSTNWPLIYAIKFMQPHFTCLLHQPFHDPLPPSDGCMLYGCPLSIQITNSATTLRLRGLSYIVTLFRKDAQQFAKNSLDWFHFDPLSLF